MFGGVFKVQVIDPVLFSLIVERSKHTLNLQVVLLYLDELRCLQGLRFEVYLKSWSVRKSFYGSNSLEP